MIKTKETVFKYRLKYRFTPGFCFYCLLFLHCPAKSSANLLQPQDLSWYLFYRGLFSRFPIN